MEQGSFPTVRSIMHDNQYNMHCPMHIMHCTSEGKFRFMYPDQKYSDQKTKEKLRD